MLIANAYNATWWPDKILFYALLKVPRVILRRKHVNFINILINFR